MLIVLNLVVFKSSYQRYNTGSQGPVSGSGVSVRLDLNTVIQLLQRSINKGSMMAQYYDLHSPSAPDMLSVGTLAHIFGWIKFAMGPLYPCRSLELKQQGTVRLD
jgi:hypothetical protein